MNRLKEIIANGRTIRYAARLLLAVIIGVALLGSLPTAVQAQPDPVDLELGGEGATGWSISNIMPGDSGAVPVTLRNTGSEDGFVTIWISDIVSGEGTNPESETGDTSGDGELDKYLQFNLSSTPSGRLSTELLSLPAIIDNFPQSVSDLNYIRMSPLDAGEEVTLGWEWELPPETGNDAQGDTLSFTINYLLEEFPPPSPPPGGGGGVPVVQRCFLDIDMLGEITTLRITCCSNKVVKDYVPTDPDEVHFLVIELDTAVFCGESPGCGEYPEIIVMSLVEEPPPAPEGVAIVGPVYDFTGYCDKHGREPCPLVTLAPPITVILSYDPGELPEDAFSPVVAYYDEEGSYWVVLPPDTGRVAEIGKVTGLADHFSLFTILAELPPPPPPPPPAPSLPPPPPPPAHFVASDLTIVPSLEKIEWGILTFVISTGQSVTVTTSVGNDGGQEGSYVANLKINGQTQDTKEITLSPGQSQGIVFSILDNEPGHYVVEIGGLAGEFQTLVWVNWWLIAGLTAAFILLVWVAWYYGYYRRRH